MFTNCFATNLCFLQLLPLLSVSSVLYFNTLFSPRKLLHFSNCVRQTRLHWFSSRAEAKYQFSPLPSWESRCQSTRWRSTRCRSIRSGFSHFSNFILWVSSSLNSDLQILLHLFLLLEEVACWGNDYCWSLLYHLPPPKSPFSSTPTLMLSLSTSAAFFLISSNICASVSDLSGEPRNTKVCAYLKGENYCVM